MQVKMVEATKNFLRMAFVMIVLALTSAGCPDATPVTDGSTPGDSKLRVCASIPPIAFAVKAIGGDRVEVSTLLRAGQSPETYEPTSKQMVELSKFKCLFGAGVPFEKQLVASVSSSMPNLRVLDLSVGLELLPAEFDCGHSHDGHEDHAHSHAHQMDPHVWMKPRLMISMAESIHAELCRQSPPDGPQFDANFATLKRTLEVLDVEIRESLASLTTRTFYVYHPSLGYFADAYDLKQTAIEQGGKEPTAKELDALVQRARSENAKLIFVQPQFSQRAAKSVADQIGGSVVALDPLSEDYVENLRHIASEIKNALGNESGDSAESHLGTNGAAHD